MLTRKYLLEIKVDDILAFQKELFELIDTKYPDVFRLIRETKELGKETEEMLITAIKECRSSLRQSKEVSFYGINS